MITTHHCNYSNGLLYNICYSKTKPLHHFYTNLQKFTPPLFHIWVFPKIGLPPKWMVYKGKPSQNWWFGGVKNPYFFSNTHICINDTTPKHRPDQVQVLLFTSELVPHFQFLLPFEFRNFHGITGRPSTPPSQRFILSTCEAQSHRGLVERWKIGGKGWVKWDQDN